jgi:hypothetical protein
MVLVFGAVLRDPIVVSICVSQLLEPHFPALVRNIQVPRISILLVRCADVTEPKNLQARNKPLYCTATTSEFAAYL